MFCVASLKSCRRKTHGKNPGVGKSTIHAKGVQIQKQITKYQLAEHPEGNPDALTRCPLASLPHAVTNSVLQSSIKHPRWDKSAGPFGSKE